MTIIRNKFLLSLSVILVLFVTTVFIYAYSSGISGRTKKTSTAGCGGCHGSAATTDVVMTWIGPDSVAAGTTALFTLTINKASKNGAGFDIAAKYGTLDTAMPLTKVLNGEIVHSANIPMVNGLSAVLFRYTAPGTPQIDTLFVTGLATNSNGSTSGDDWNWASNRPVRVVNPIGIEENSTASRFKLNQNYPNPFNPSTTITFELYKPGNVKLVVYDVLGNEVETLLDGNLREGQHSVIWDLSASKAKASSGIYFYKLMTDNVQDIKKMMLTK